MSGRVRHLQRSASRPALTVLGVVIAVLFAVAPAHGATAPPDVARRGPVGLDTLRRLDRLPFLREGVRTYQVSSADPTGRNDDGFTGRYSCRRRVPGGCLLADHTGPGELDSVWSPGPFFGDVSSIGRLVIELDGREVVNAPMQSIVDGRLGEPFVAPFVLTTARTPGGFSVNLPMTFRRRMRVIAEKNPGYWHVVYRAFASATGIRTFSPGDERPIRIPAGLRRPGTRAPMPRTAGSKVSRRSFDLAPGRQAVIARLDGSAAMNALSLRFSRFGPWVAGEDASDPEKASDLLKRARLLVRFDGQRTVDAPLGEFFGSGLGPARVRSLLFALDEDPHGWASSWWPMPFRRSAVVRCATPRAPRSAPPR